MNADFTCSTCRHWQRDETARDYLRVNFMVGKCSMGRALSHGVTRSHDSCELHTSVLPQKSSMAWLIVIWSLSAICAAIALYRLINP